MTEERPPIPLIYIAGPYRADTKQGIELNRRVAELIGMHVARAGGYPVIPHNNTPQCFEGLQPDGFWLEGTLALAETCHGMVMCPGWQFSEGSRGERDLFMRIGRPVLVYDGPRKLDELVEQAREIKWAVDSQRLADEAPKPTPRRMYQYISEPTAEDRACGHVAIDFDAILAALGMNTLSQGVDHVVWRISKASSEYLEGNNRMIAHRDLHGLDAVIAAEVRMIQNEASP